MSNIPSNAFGRCADGLVVDIPNGVTSIGTYTFSPIKTKIINCYADSPPHSEVYSFNNAYDGQGERFVLHVKKGLLDTYASEWGSVSGLFMIVDDLEDPDDETVALKGDVNGDGKVNIADCNAVLKIIANK